MTTYEMAIVFTLDISLPELNQITEQIDGGHLVIKNAKELIIQQTVGFVPDEETLLKYADAIKTTMNESGKIHVDAVRFSRYNYIRPIEIPEEPTPKETT